MGKETKVIAVAIQKGGCGKTLTSLNLAYSLAQKGKKVLLIDNDPQATSSLLLNIDINDEEVLGTQNVLEHQMYVTTGEEKYDKEYVAKCILTPTYFKAVKEKGKYISKEFSFGFDLMPARIELANYDISLANFELDGRMAGGFVMKNAIDNIKKNFDYDFIIIDVLPGLNMLAYNAIGAAYNGGVIMVINMDRSAITGGENLLNTVTEIQHLYWQYQNENGEYIDKPKELQVKHDGILGVLKNRYVPHLKISQDINNELSTYFGPAYVFNTTIPQSTKCDQAHSEGRLYAEYSKDARDAFSALADEVIEQCDIKTKLEKPDFIDVFGKAYYEGIENK